MFSVRLISNQLRRKATVRSLSSLNQASALKNIFINSTKKTDDIPITAAVSEKVKVDAKAATVPPPSMESPPIVHMPAHAPASVVSIQPISTPVTEALRGFSARICVIGVGGGGCNAVDNMIKQGLTGVNFISANTDAQHLDRTLTPAKIQLGRETTQGLGCGANPGVGRSAALESREEISNLIGDAHMVFIAAGMGGGTGTGAAPVIAEMCKEKGILTVAVVTLPFDYEGKHRGKLAVEGLKALQDRTDTLITVRNENTMSLLGPGSPMSEALGYGDMVMYAGVKSITDMISTPGMINLDFADVKSVMSGMGHAIMGTGVSEGADRAAKAANDAMNNPLLGLRMNIQSAKGMLVNVSGGDDLTMEEVVTAASMITNSMEDEDAISIFGTSHDPSLHGLIKVSLVATGIDVMPSTEHPQTSRKPI